MGTGPVYATIEELYQAIPRGSLVAPSRIVASVDTANDRLSVEGHGFSEGTKISFVADPSATLPSPLAALTLYYAKPVSLGGGLYSDSLFQVSATDGGSAINLTSSGSGVFRVQAPLHGAVQAELETQSRWIDSLLSGHEVPLSEPYPRWVVSVVCKRAAASMIRMLGLARLQHIVDEAAEATKDVLRISASGQALRDPDALTTTGNPTGASGANGSAGRWYARGRYL